MLCKLVPMPLSACESRPAALQLTPVSYKRMVQPSSSNQGAVVSSLVTLKRHSPVQAAAVQHVVQRCQIGLNWMKQHRPQSMLNQSTFRGRKSEALRSAHTSRYFLLPVNVLSVVCTRCSLVCG